MKKIIEIKIKENRVVVFNDIVHVADTNVVEVSGKFEYNFNSDFKDTTLEILSVNGDIVKTKTANIVDNKFNILLDNELFKQKGTVQNTIKIIKDDKVLYINDSFKIKVKDDVEISVNSEDKVSLSQVESLIASKIANTNNQNINLDELKETIKDIVNSTEKIDIEDIKELIDEKISAIKTLNIEEVETIVNDKINKLGGTMDNSKLDEILEAVKSTNTNANINKNDVASIYKLINSENKEINITLTDVATLDEVIDTKLDTIILGANKVNITTLKKNYEALQEQSAEKLEELGIIEYEYTMNEKPIKVRRYKNNNDWIVFDDWNNYGMLGKEDVNTILENLQFNKELKYVYAAQVYNNYEIYQHLYNTNWAAISGSDPYKSFGLAPIVSERSSFSINAFGRTTSFYPSSKTYMKLVDNIDELKETVKELIIIHSIHSSQLISEEFTKSINLAEE